MTAAGAPVFFASAAKFRTWLEKHHAAKPELVVGFYKRKLGRGITYPEALDEALCFGWIDGVRRNVDEDSYAIRFTPRKKDSNWSDVNIKRAKELIAGGRMTEAGQRAFDARENSKRGSYSYESATAELSAAFDKALRANKTAAAFFDSQPPGYRRTATFWVMSAKRPETREKRFAHLLERSASGKRIDLLNPNR